MSETITVNCPTCGKTVVWGEISPFRPFCSKRCQLIDLGEWAAEENESPAVAIFPKAMTGAKSQSSDICLMPHVGLIRRGQRRIRHLVQMSDAA
ncbi:zinc-binding protein [Escherichia coli]|nr:zinc-binding protein [Escherichia coli]